MATFFRFLSRLLRLFVGSPPPAQPPAQSPAQPSVSLPTQPVRPNQPPAVTPSGSAQSPQDPLPSAVPPQDELAGIDIPGFPDPVPPARRWTLMIFMAGDNGLKFETEAGWEQVMAEMTSAGYKDIVELRTAGTSDEVACVVQFDTVSEADHSYRIIINPPGQAPTVQNIPETNTGDPATLTDFIVWGQRTFPADHYAVVIWNHGGGWKEDDLWARYRDAMPLGVRGVGRRRSLSKIRMGKSLFLRTTDRIMALSDDAPPPATRSVISPPSTRSLDDSPDPGAIDMPGSDTPLLDRIMAAPSAQDHEEDSTRWIAADDSSKDFLDNSELQLAFQQAALATGETVDIIGMDACLMAMVEVAYQLRNNATFLVASQEVEPMNGWDYTRLLQAMVGNPALRPEQLAQTMVDLYMDSYAGRNEPITQSATILPQLDALAELLNRFVVAADLHWDDHPALATALRRAKANALRFDDPDYRDLADFLRLVAEEMAILRAADETHEPGVAGAAEAVDRATQSILHVMGDPVRSPVLAAGAAGVNYQQSGTGAYRANGLTIYLPDQHISQFYDGLDFRISRWGDLIRRLNGIVA